MPWINELKDYEGTTDHDLLVSKSKEVFERHAVIQDIAKQTARKALLERDPSLRIRVSTQRLRSIVDYKSFKCSPFSSVARDQAIFGSDIDGGIVITEQTVTKNDQLAFIEELRTQGFDAYHKSEVNFVARKLAQMENDWWNQDNPGELPTEISCWQYTESHMIDSAVRFVTKPGINRIINSRRLIMPLMIYLAGHSIE